ncbi:hypothetical protein P4518_14675, partial [Geobacillus thermodenitrificans]|uniref:hypothetical protein n=1 Tax=Geobacillus thermodenitrificans TaxID=33940 RepID=UPI002E1AA48F|nr:hypothetical protein [Geobacillus thermodenitrificans]
LDIGRVLLSLECFGPNQRIPYLFSFGLAKCFTQNFIHHRKNVSVEDKRLTVPMAVRGESPL